MDKQVKPAVLVTGLSGMVGDRFHKLYENKYQFENIDLSLGVDITQKDQVDQKVKDSKAEGLIHLAAFTNVSAAHEQLNDKLGSCYQVNVLGTENIAHACKQYGKYLIHVSTDFVFDGLKDEPYTEADEPEPIEWYGQTKFWAEGKVRQILPKSQYVILRLAYPYQAKPIRPDLLNNLVNRLKNGTLPPQFEDHTITPTFVDDVAGVFDYCLKHKPEGLYHCVGSSSHTDHEIAQMVKEVFSLPGEVKPGSLADYLNTINRPYQKTMRVSNQKLVHDFGLKMKTFEEGLEEIKKQNLPLRMF